MYQENTYINNCCGFVSIFNGMKCETPEILNNYNIKNVSDLIELIINGNENYESLFEKCINDNEAFEHFNKICDFNFTKKMYNYLLKDTHNKLKEKNINKDAINGISVGWFFFTFVSFYFKINFKLVINRQSDIKHFSDIKHVIEKSNKLLEKFNIYIPIILSVNHAEFKPDYDSNTEKYKVLTKIKKYQESKMVADEVMYDFNLGEIEYDDKFFKNSNLENELAELDKYDFPLDKVK